MGTATITVTASDPMGELYAMQTFMVTVEEANVAPMAGDDVADQMVYVGAMVEVQSNFSDPDEDMLSYTATILATMMDVATATVDDMGMVTITGVAEGMATITVTASDPGELYAMQDHHGHRHDDAADGVGRYVHHQRNEQRRRHEATIMIMPGDNATKHWASGQQPTDLSQGMWHSDEALAGDADHGHHLWPDQRHELLVHRHRRSRYGHRLRMVRLERLDCGDADPVAHG